MTDILSRGISVEKYYQRMQDHFTLEDAKGNDRILYREDTSARKFPCHNGNHQNLDECTESCISLGSNCEQSSKRIKDLQNEGYYFSTWALDLQEKTEKIEKARYKVSRMDDSDFECLYIKDENYTSHFEANIINKSRFVLNRNRTNPWTPQIYSSKMFDSSSVELYPAECYTGNQSLEDYINSLEYETTLRNIYLSERNNLTTSGHNGEIPLHFSESVFDNFTATFSLVNSFHSSIINSKLELVIGFLPINYAHDEYPLFQIKNSTIYNSSITVVNFNSKIDDAFELGCSDSHFHNCKISTRLDSQNLEFENCAFNNCIFDLVNPVKFINCKFTNLPNNLNIMSKSFDVPQPSKEILNRISKL